MVLDDSFIADSHSSLFPGLRTSAESFGGTQYRNVPAHFHPWVQYQSCLQLELVLTQFSNFTKKNYRNVKEILQQLSFSSCCLDVLSIALIKKALPFISSDLTQIINTSFIFRCFPSGQESRNE
ncbi:hypothetical protein CHARACLAT_026187, partial [Characodon lateralis]|nr:hypothetical protein [Characodon lateralis]